MWKIWGKKDFPLWFSHSNFFLKLNLDLFYCFPRITFRLIGASGQEILHRNYCVMISKNALSWVHIFNSQVGLPHTLKRLMCLNTQCVNLKQCYVEWGGLLYWWPPMNHLLGQALIQFPLFSIQMGPVTCFNQQNAVVVMC